MRSLAEMSNEQVPYDQLTDWQSCDMIKWHKCQYDHEINLMIVTELSFDQVSSEQIWSSVRNVKINVKWQKFQWQKWQNVILCEDDKSQKCHLSCDQVTKCVILFVNVWNDKILIWSSDRSVNNKVSETRVSDRCEWSSDRSVNMIIWQITKILLI